MGIRLILLNWWTPKKILIHELDNLYRHTTCALKALLNDKVPAYNHSSIILNDLSSGTLEERRAVMAKTHTALVEALVAALGREETVRLGREAMFKVGEQLGNEARIRLGVSDNPKDVIRAAKVLYRVLGISFIVRWYNRQKATLFVNRCTLAKYYSEITCLVLSAADEGVVKGLNPDLCLSFEDRITNGCSKCVANIISDSN
jgi:hypothetical protein